MTAPFEASLDHSSCLHLDDARNFDPERFGGFRIDHEFESGRLLDRQGAGVCASENLVDIAGRSAHLILVVRSIGHQPTRVGEWALSRDDRHAGLGRESDNRGAVIVEKRAIEHIQSPGARSVDSREPGLDLNEVIAFVSERVAPYKKIRHIEAVEAIPKNPSGKILRRQLIEEERARERA